MSLVAFIVVAALAALAWWPLGRWSRARSGFGLVALLVCTALADRLPTSGVTVFGDEALQTTAYLRLWLLSGAAAALLLALVAELLGRPTRFVPAALVMLAGTAAALSLTDGPGALLLVIATTALVGLIALADRDQGRGAVRIEGLRVTVAVAVLALIGMAWAAAGGLALQPVTVVVAFALVAAALLVGTAAVPFHLPLVHQAETAARPILPLVVGWLPAALALVLLGWLDTRLVPLAPDLGPVRGLVVLLGLLTLIAAAVAMVLQDDLGHLVAYAGLQGLAVGVIAFSAVAGPALPAARVALLSLPLWLAALVAATLVLDTAAGTARVPDLGGWARRTPLTAAAMAVAVAVAIGVPGLAGFDARRTILDLAAGPVLGALGLVAGAASIVAWGRLAWIGLRQGPTGAWGSQERPTRPPGGTPLTPGGLRRLVTANRLPLAALLVVALVVLPLALDLGPGHLVQAATGPVPAASPRATPTPGPTPSATATAPAAGPTAGPTGGPTPSGSSVGD